MTNLDAAKLARTWLDYAKERDRRAAVLEGGCGLVDRLNAARQRGRADAWREAVRQLQAAQVAS